jgi:hypothetical protein
MEQKRAQIWVTMYIVTWFLTRKPKQLAEKSKCLWQWDSSNRYRWEKQRILTPSRTTHKNQFKVDYSSKSKNNKVIERKYKIFLCFDVSKHFLERTYKIWIIKRKMRKWMIKIKMHIRQKVPQRKYSWHNYLPKGLYLEYWLPQVNNKEKQHKL